MAFEANVLGSYHISTDRGINSIMTVEGSGVGGEGK